MSKNRFTPDVRKHQIVSAALVVARRLGYSGVTYSAIAREVGISAPSVVYHYNTMTQLRRAVMRHAVKKNDALVVAMGAKAGDRNALQAPIELITEGSNELKEWEPCMN